MKKIYLQINTDLTHFDEFAIRAYEDALIEECKKEKRIREDLVLINRYCDNTTVGREMDLLGEADYYVNAYTNPLRNNSLCDMGDIYNTRRNEGFEWIAMSYHDEDLEMLGEITEEPNIFYKVMMEHGYSKSYCFCARWHIICFKGDNFYGMPVAKYPCRRWPNEAKERENGNIDHIFKKHCANEIYI